jgi:shikimate 5-dehydrogenase
MLVEQGALSLEYWTGKEAPREVMRKTVGAKSERSRSW